MPKHTIKGKLEIICGSMFSGKSEELIRRIRRSEIAHQKVSVFKHKFDNRMSIDYILSHSGDKCKAIAIDNPHDIRLFIGDDTKVIAIDEVQFFGEEIIPLLLSLLDEGKSVIAAGLDLDFRGIPFGCMPTLMAVANTITKLAAVCMVCGNKAMFSQRLINGRAAKFDDPLIFIGAQDSYQARCRDCFSIDRTAWQEHQIENHG